MLRKIVVVNGDTLTIPELSQFKGRKVEVTFREFPRKIKKRKDLSEFFGSLGTGEDGMTFQKKMRAEWAEREKSS